jgi:outer membrane protein OmpA-like peptidoglycan-associated protein
MKKLTVTALVLALSAAGCADMSATQRGTATGAGVGAGVGALLGAATGNGGAGRALGGAAIGGAIGAVAGNVWSTRMENQKRAMEQASKGTGVQVTQTADNRLKLEIPSDVSFDVGRADIKPNMRPVLDRFAATLAENQSTVITIIGHTDNTGSDAVNDPLSRERAIRTRDYLSIRGVSPSRFSVEGHGSHEPLAPNNSDANRAHNRRVEIFVAEPQQQPPQPQPR